MGLSLIESRDFFEANQDIYWPSDPVDFHNIGSLSDIAKKSGELLKRRMGGSRR